MGETLLPEDMVHYDIILVGVDADRFCLLKSP